MNRRLKLAVSIVAVLVGLVLVVVALLSKDDEHTTSLATSSPAVDCDPRGAPDYVRREAFERADASNPRPTTAEFVKSTRSGAQSVASDPSAVVPDDEPAYLVQITGGGFEHPGGQIGGSVRRSPVLSLTISIAREFTTDAGYTSTAADLSTLGPVGTFSLDPSCAPPTDHSS